LRDIISSYSNAVEIFWVQEEPQNMGAWNFIFPKLLALINKNQQLKFIGRVESPSPASGSVKLHIISQEEIIKSAFN
jgi:2-oxoglutarate dehydrogenase E1 component